MSRRGGIATVVLLAWLAGIGVFARRELFRAPEQRLREAALRVAPGASYYQVEQHGRHIGFASSTIDTTSGGLRITDYLVADIPVAGKVHRATAQSVVRLSRALALRDFTISFESDGAPIAVSGRTEGDSLLLFAIALDSSTAPDTQRVRLEKPILLPTLLPLAVALGERPAPGKSYTYSTFDPTAMAPRDTRVRVVAESVFVVGDSARFDTAARRWVVARRDTVRAWQLATDGPSGFGGWVDEQGRIVRLTQSLGFDITRTAFEVAFENWRATRTADGARIARDRDILETTAIAASTPIDRARIGSLRVRLHGVDLRGFDLAGTGQTLSGDTLLVTRTAPSALVADYRLPMRPPMRARFTVELDAEPLLERSHPEIVALARRLMAESRDPREVTQRLVTWVHDSVRKQITVSVPSALQVLRARSGDCNEHTQLFLALARAAGIPARPAAGLAYIGGKFYYHAWPEVYLGDWVPVDPTFGQFPADAAHLRFIHGGLARQAELIRLMGRLGIDVLERHTD